MGSLFLIRGHVHIFICIVIVAIVIAIAIIITYHVPLVHSIFQRITDCIFFWRVFHFFLMGAVVGIMNATVYFVGVVMVIVSSNISIIGIISICICIVSSDGTVLNLHSPRNSIPDSQSAKIHGTCRILSSSSPTPHRFIPTITTTITTGSTVHGISAQIANNSLHNLLRSFHLGKHARVGGIPRMDVLVPAIVPIGKESLPLFVVSKRIFNQEGMERLELGPHLVEVAVLLRTIRLVLMSLPLVLVLESLQSTFHDMVVMTIVFINEGFGIDSLFGYGNLLLRFLLVFLVLLLLVPSIGTPTVQVCIVQLHNLLGRHLEIDAQLPH
mmetsp:Transcript_24367/g.50087  ORF Transcript_24367/g.50087 Transcript_24367/m.50087 type:complete len:327 (+) Transcript_24367:375-1355(+)